MKTTLTLLPILALVAFVSLTGCKSELDNKPTAKVEEPTPAGDKAAKEAPAEAGEKAAAEEAPKEEKRDTGAMALTLDTAKSTLGFVGAKVTGDHKCSFKTFSGKATVADGQPATIEFTVQMDSVETDAEKLTGHLKSPDFFDVAKFPTSTFKATEITKGGEAGATHTIAGELTLHGVTKKITFPATVAITPEGATGKSEFKINRKDFGIVYPGKPDDLIRDEVLLKLDLVFTKAS